MSHEYWRNLADWKVSPCKCDNTQLSNQAYLLYIELQSGRTLSMVALQCSCSLCFCTDFVKVRLSKLEPCVINTIWRAHAASSGHQADVVRRLPDKHVLQGGPTLEHLGMLRMLCTSVMCLILQLNAPWQSQRVPGRERLPRGLPTEAPCWTHAAGLPAGLIRQGRACLKASRRARWPN